jgi:hypothetical protein
MRKTIKRTTAVLLILAVLLTAFVCVADAAYIPPDSMEYTITRPRMFIVGSTATCSASLKAPGQYIDATLELKQGSTVVASWSDSATGELILSGTATVTSGVTYTLTVYGTIDGVAFTPASITRTP